jgi:uncharacterized protein with HEPN domain
MRIETKKLLHDALEAWQSIQEHCAGRTLARYSQDRWFRRAVEREFEIIGGALNRLARGDPPSTERIPALRRIVNFRNRIIHAYDAIDDEVVWGIVGTDLPALRLQIEGLVAERER